MNPDTTNYDLTKIPRCKKLRLPMFNKLNLTNFQIMILPMFNSYNITDVEQFAILPLFNKLQYYRC